MKKKRQPLLCIFYFYRFGSNMKFQPCAYKHLLIVLLACTSPLLALGQYDISRANNKQSQLYNSPRNAYPQYEWSRHRIHFGMGLTTGILNAKQSIAEGFSVAFAYDIFKTDWTSLSIEANPKIGLENMGWPDLGNFVGDLFSNTEVNSPQTTSTTFSEYPLILDYNINFGHDKYAPPAFGFYFGGGMSYVVTAYESNTSFTENACFFGYAINCGARLGALDVGFTAVTSLRKPIDQITNPVFYEIHISIRR